MSKLIVTIEEGKLRGIESKNYLKETFYSFLGIPYAEPPIGDLRFKAPIPKKPWKCIRDATKEGPPCPSPHMFFQFYVGSENNCLNLNVYTKTLSVNSSLRPVMIWIHGGAFIMGCNTRKIFGPDYLMTEDIVLVTINYRLGILGFLCLEDPNLGVPGNAGMKDMVLALKWVQRNIKYFNGDPNNVTIFGESAGGASVHYLCLSPMAKGLFHKAIAQSGCTLNYWANGRRNAKIVAALLGISEKDEAGIFHYLQNLSPKKIVKIQYKLKQSDVMTADEAMPFAPVVEVPSEEPAFLLEKPIDILKKGTFNNVPLIIGYTSDEGILYQLALNMLNHVKNHNNLEKDIPFDLNLTKGSEKSLDTVKQIQQFYFGGENITKKNRQKFLTLKADNHFVHGIHRTVYYMKLSNTAPIFLYRMSLETKLNLIKEICTSQCVICLLIYLFFSYKCCCGPSCRLRKLLFPRKEIEGACHGDDVPYLFKCFADCKIREGSNEEIYVKRFLKLWTNFARTGNPTPTKTDLIDILWKPVSRNANFYLDIGKELKMGENPDAERMKLWDSFYE